MALSWLDRKGLGELGGKGLIYKQVVGKASYISGVPDLDSKIDANSIFTLPVLVNFCKRSQGLEISLMNQLKLRRTGIRNDRLTGITLEDRDQIVDQKEKSIVGRAILGGLIFGPVGAIVGGMTGIGTKTVALPTPDLFLSINYLTEQGEEAIFLCACEHKNRAAIYSFFVKEYPQFFKFEKK